MKSIMYGASNHWIMLKNTTNNPIERKSNPISDSITVKNKVDRPMITANVPTTEKRSFHKLELILALPLNTKNGIARLIIFVPNGFFLQPRSLGENLGILQVFAIALIANSVLLKDRSATGFLFVFLSVNLAS